jgi:hypothetical protein
MPYCAAFRIAFYDAKAEAQRDVQAGIAHSLHVLRAEAIDKPRAQRLDVEHVGVLQKRPDVRRFERVEALLAETLVVGRLVPLPQPVWGRGALPREPCAPCVRGGLGVGRVHDHERQRQKLCGSDVLQDLCDPAWRRQRIEQHTDAQRPIERGRLDVDCRHAIGANWRKCVWVDEG